MGLVCTGSLRAQFPDTSRSVKTSVEAVAAEIEVLVLDAKGVPVEDLTKSDFKLFVNGRETPIDFFEAPPMRSPEAASPTTKGALATVPSPERRAHSTVFVISDLHVDLRSRNSALDALQAYADMLPAGEPAAVYLLDSGVRRLQGFTTDRKALRKALANPKRRLPRSYVFTGTHGEEWAGQSRQMLRNFAAVLDGLTSRPEPKTVLVVTGPLSPAGLVEPIGGEAAAEARASALEGPYTGVFATRGLWNFLYEADNCEGQALLARATIVALDPTGLNSPDANAEINSIISTAELGRRELSRPSRLRSADASSESDRTRTDSWEFRNDTFAMLAVAPPRKALPPRLHAAGRDVRAARDPGRRSAPGHRRANSERTALADGRDRCALALRGTPPLG